MLIRGSPCDLCSKQTKNVAQSIVHNDMSTLENRIYWKTLWYEYFFNAVYFSMRSKLNHHTCIPKISYLR